MKKVYSALSPMIHIMKALLEDEGIVTAVQGEHIFAVQGEFIPPLPSLWVRDEDHERAVKIVDKASETH